LSASTSIWKLENLRVEFSAVSFLGWARRFGVKASKFTDAQKAFVIMQGNDGTPVADICRKAGISQATYFNWKKEHAELTPSEMRRLRELEGENSRLKKIVADLTLERERLQDVIKRKL
jgi:putative transposase